MDLLQGFPINYAGYYPIQQSARPSGFAPMAPPPNVRALLTEVLHALQQLTAAWSHMNQQPPQQQAPQSQQPNRGFDFGPPSAEYSPPRQPVNSNGNSRNNDPAFLAGLTGNNAPLQIYGKGVEGNDAAIGNASGPNTVEGVRNGSQGSGNVNALNKSEGPNNFGTFANNTVPNGMLNLNQAQISEVSKLSPTQLAAMHLWGIQMTSAGKQDGGILENVLQNPKGFTSGEVQLATQLANEDRQKYGGITGKSLDQAFFGVYQNITGENIASQFENAPIHYSQGPVDLNKRITGDNGLNSFENTVMVLWGHTPLFGNGINGALESDILAGKDTLFGNSGVNVREVEALAKADVLQSGQITGNSLNKAMIDTMKNIYFGAPQATAQRTVTEALQQAVQSGRPLPTGQQLDAQVAKAIKETPASQIPVGVNINSGNVKNCPFLNGAKAA